VLLSDSSDVEDEASSYFCIDDDPKYHKYCTTAPGAVPEPVIKRDFFIDHFVVTNRVRVTIKRWIQRRLGNRRASIDDDHNRIGWTTRNVDPARYKPLGVDGGIARSLANMERLSDLLASRGIPLTIEVYPWAQQIAQDDRDSARGSCGGISAPTAARPLSTCSRRSSPSPIETRIGTSGSTSSATTIFPRMATGCFSRSFRSACCLDTAGG